MNKPNNIMEDLLNAKDAVNIPKVGEVVKAKVVAVGKTEVYLDIEGATGGLVRHKELASETEEYAHLKPGDEVTATVIDQENEKGLIELSFRSAGYQKTWNNLQSAKQEDKVVEIKVTAANKGGLMVLYNNSEGFLPVSQLNREHYPRVEGGNKSKILEKLKQLVGKKLKAKILTVDEDTQKIIFSEKEVYAQDKIEQLNKYKVGDVVECLVTGLVDFGVFVEFGESLEGLIHISELAWQRIDHPKNLFKIGEKIQAQIIGIDGERVTLSAKKLVADPWKKATEKFKVGDTVKGKVLKFDKFGVFVDLGDDIHGLVHVSELSDEKVEKAEEVVKVGEEHKFKILSIEPEDHRLGLSLKAVGK